MLTGTCLCGACAWRFDTTPRSATACNCAACRRYGVLWIYGHKDDDVHLDGPIRAFVRTDIGEAELSFDHCATCGCVLAWTGLGPGRDGRTRRAVNLRLADDPGSEAVQALPIRHFDGAGSFEDLPADGRTVRDMWF